LNPEAKVTSFVLRFVQDEQAGPTQNVAALWYGVIRHVQSDVERRYTRWEDVVAFIEQYVDLSKGAEDE